MCPLLEQHLFGWKTCGMEPPPELDGETSGGAAFGVEKMPGSRENAKNTAGSAWGGQFNPFTLSLIIIKDFLYGRTFLCMNI